MSSADDDKSRAGREARDVVFLLPVSSQPRYHKRIRGLQSAGLNVRALHFERTYFKGAGLPCPAKSLGSMAQGAYVSRMLRLTLALRKARRALRDADVVYAFGLDMAILAALATPRRRTSLVYELGDIRTAQLDRGLKGRLVRTLERWVVNRAREVVVTARGFAEGYLGPYLGMDSRRARVLENRLDLPIGQRPQPQVHVSSNPIVIGYFGLLRCEKSWQTLQELTRIVEGSIKIVARGYAFGISLNDVGQNPHIHFGGEFVAPAELPDMYAAVDLVWGCYPAPESTAGGNWQWARTNRFYESCYFKRPLITLAGTDEARVVEAHGIGIAVDLSDPSSAARSLYAQLINSLERWQRNAAAVPDAVCVYTDEHEQLASSICRLS